MLRNAYNKKRWGRERQQGSEYSNIRCNVQSADPYHEESEEEPLPKSTNAKFLCNILGVKAIQFLIDIDERYLKSHEEEKRC